MSNGPLIVRVGVILAGAVAASYLLARLGEPQSAWLWGML
ncbi:hypothetical protein L284_19105 [Novosphingobium lindaniclasticum LE124]|uniref:Uncharacterized protein n=1 Tax=Novosphingobium lindaniclasticum LE124 TaxID=1096930 RepID=T0HC57_9SPHN|nr:hypothetical protein L284_19105 [Novosphingobium lindaniclasticum LE124]